MRKSIIIVSVFIALAAMVYSGCRRDNALIDIAESEYPEAVGRIMLTKCATSGCHNTISKDACAGLDLSSWNKMMQGDRNGAVCIPYSHDYSTLFLFTNSFTDLGPVVPPTMPINGEPLSREDIIMLRDWIDAGAPNAAGFVKWSDNPNRQKYYVSNQGCDVICTIDAETGLQMRYIPVGAEATIESPHNVKVSPDGQYWYCCFSAGRYIEKHRTSDDMLVGRVRLGPSDSAAAGSWNTLSITPDSRYAMVVDWSPQGRVALVDVEHMQWRVTWQGSGLFTQPHGSFVQVRHDTTFFIATANAGNYIYRMDTMQFPYPLSVQYPDQFLIPIDGTSNASNNNLVNVHELVFSPDGSKYFVTCQKSNTVNVMDANTDQFITSIPVGVYAQELAISEDPSTPYLYVTCSEDTATYPGNRGSVYIINWQTNTVVGHVNSGYQPHGLLVDDDRHVVLIANRNAFPGGPAPHHATACAGTNGYITYIDMYTNQLMTGPKKRIEVAVDPYAASYRR